MCSYMTYAVNSDAYICSAQSKNRNISGIVLRKVGILRLSSKEEFCTLRKTIPELSLRKVRIGANAVVLLFYVHGKHLRSCRDGQLT